MQYLRSQFVKAMAVNKWLPNFSWSLTVCESRSVTTYQGKL